MIKITGSAFFFVYGVRIFTRLFKISKESESEMYSSIKNEFVCYMLLVRIFA